MSFDEFDILAARVLHTLSLLRCSSVPCMTMTSEDEDISALLSEPSLPEEQPEASGSDDFLPAILESIKSNEKAVELSPEEAAWADSCFVQTSELTDGDWGTMKKALLDSLEKPTGSPSDRSEVLHDQGTHVISEEEPHSLHVENVTRHNDVDMEQSGNSDDDKASAETFRVADVIRGADGHAKQMDGYREKPEGEDELVATAVVEQAESRDSIFKVWDLGVSVSDDEGEPELFKDLKKLLRDNPREAAYPHPIDTDKALSQINIDELVVGLGDLSLQQTNE